jgi:polysaccharide biosynthesis/export protein
MYRKYINFLLLIVVVVYISSCVDTKKATYFDNAPIGNITTSNEDKISPLIQNNDILNVTITSLNAEASAIFNLTDKTSGSTVTNAANGQTGSGYLVNSDGYIQLPILGNIKVAGSTSKEVRDHITSILIEKKLLIDPIVTIRHLNYEVTVIGEVGRPTVINVPNEKISLLKALGLAGDITIYGKKDNVLLIREISGKRTVNRINLKSPDFLSSPYYYLQPNDMVYVEADRDKAVISSASRQSLPLILSALSVLLLTVQIIKY